MAFFIPIISVVICISLSPVADAENQENQMYYCNSDWGLSFVVPEELARDLRIDAYEERIDLIYTPAADNSGYNGCVFSINKVTPKKEYYNRGSCGWYAWNTSILAAGKDTYYVCTQIGGIDSKKETISAYTVYSKQLLDAIRDTITVKEADIIPEINIDSIIHSLDSCGDKLDRGKFAMMIYDSLGVEKRECSECAYADIDVNNPCAEAVEYLTRIGVLHGDPGGTFRPDDQVSRAEFVTIVHRMLLIPTPAWYGDAIAFTDTSEQHWAWDDLNLACQENFLVGTSDGKLRPDEVITLEDAQHILLMIKGYQMQS